MLNRRILAALAATISLSNALPNQIPGTAAPGNLDSDSVLYAWKSNDPSCTNNAKIADCKTATLNICAGTDLTKNNASTVGDCTAVYWFDAGNTIPSEATCAAAYAQILAAGVGGALGYNANRNRTSDPLYVVYPKSKGTGNCFKLVDDDAPVVAADVLPNGKTLGDCPTTSRRALAMLEDRQNAPVDPQAGVKECLVEDFVWGGACSAVCLATVVSTSWLTGPFAVAAGLACFGGCEASGIKLYDNCMKAKGSDPSIPDHWKRTNPNTGGADVSGNVCLDIKDNLKFECPAMQNALLGYHNCPAPSQDGVSGSIHF